MSLFIDNKKLQKNNYKTVLMVIYVGCGSQNNNVG